MMHHSRFLLHSFLAESAARSPDAIAVVCDGQRITCRDIDRRSNALAHALAARGVERGDRVVIAKSELG
jgi:long-chain acyl-CoA synthetase